MAEKLVKSIRRMKWTKNKSHNWSNKKFEKWSKNKLKSGWKNGQKISRKSDWKMRKKKLEKLVKKWSSKRARKSGWKRGRISKTWVKKRWKKWEMDEKMIEMYYEGHPGLFFYFVSSHLKILQNKSLKIYKFYDWLKFVDCQLSLLTSSSNL